MSDLVKQEKIPLALGAHMAAQIMEMMDNEETIDNILLSLFDVSMANVSDAVDRRIAFLQIKDATTAYLKSMYTRFKERASMLEDLTARLKEDTKHIIESNPGVPLKGKTGAFRLHKNPSKVSYVFERKDITIHNAVPIETLEFFSVPSRYTKEFHIFALDTNAIKKDLDDGVQMDWAKPEQGSHVRIKI